MNEIPLHRERLNLPDKDAGQKLTEKKRKQMTQDMAKVFGPVEGRRVLRFLMDLAGYRRGKIGGNPQLGMDVAMGTFYNACREGLCVEFMELIPDYIRKDVDYGTFEEFLD